MTEVMSAGGFGLWQGQGHRGLRNQHCRCKENPLSCACLCHWDWVESVQPGRRGKQLCLYPPNSCLMGIRIMFEDMKIFDNVLYCIWKGAGFCIGGTALIRGVACVEGAHPLGQICRSRSDGLCVSTVTLICNLSRRRPKCQSCVVGKLVALLSSPACNLSALYLCQLVYVLAVLQWIQIASWRKVYHCPLDNWRLHWRLLLSSAGFFLCSTS